MAGNPVPIGQDELLALAEDIADGCHRLEAEVGLQHNTEAVIRADITGLRNAEAVFGRAKADRQKARVSVQTADAAAVQFLGNSRRVLVSFLGNDWSAAWEPTGFPDRSTKVPRTRDKRLNLCAALQIHFTNVPAHEVAALGVTAALAGTRFQALSDGRDAFGLKSEAQAVAKQARQAAYHRLRKRLHDFINELDTLIAADDPRWEAFGLNRPAAPTVPDRVKDVTLTPGLPGQLLSQWPRAMRAKRYRPFVQVVGVDAKPVARDAVHDVTTTLTGFAPGQTVQVFIVAANDTGEAPASPTKQLVLP